MLTYWFRVMILTFIVKNLKSLDHLCAPIEYKTKQVLDYTKKEEPEKGTIRLNQDSRQNSEKKSCSLLSDIWNSLIIFWVPKAWIAQQLLLW